MNAWSLSMNEDIFNTPEEEARKLAEEIKGLREVLNDLSRTLSKIENRFQRAFPSLPLRPVRIKKGVSSVREQPTLTPEKALQLYDELVQQAKAGDTKTIKERLASISIADLSLLRQELGISLGKKKPSRKALIEAVWGRINESLMLSKHVNREEMLNISSEHKSINENKSEN
jgi:hypothetical protein